MKENSRTSSERSPVGPRDSFRTKILVIVGPTASGKTSLALAIAGRIPCELISADSRQVYRMLDIGTAKPSAEELAKVPHHFINLLSPNEHFTAGDFAAQGRKIISEIVKKNALPIIVGGTGLYVQTLVDGIFSGPGMIKELRGELETRIKQGGAEALWQELRRVDPASAEKISPTKTRRIIRALEVFYATGKPISLHHAEQNRAPEFDATFIGLRWLRRVLYERINARVDRMLNEGFLDEVKRLLDAGYDERFKALQTVGYKEAFAYLREELSYANMVEAMKQNTRRYAKRQMTWFRRDERIQWFDVERDEEIAGIAKNVVEMI
ncbi:MAG: tRNA (adenosine(37)-N6)-dimethylallyltransferase MiaA [Bacteroidota bacterium]|nr:tRNA (adenosine(37)-N6)-dimethylallyltransferase MiaA [Bacteroidota bacterium]